MSALITEEVTTRGARPPVPPLAWAAALVGLAALLARPWFLPAGVGVAWRVAFFLALGGAAVGWPLAGGTRASPSASLAVLALGAGTFTLGRAVLDVPATGGSVGVALALNALAAVAEEAFFRRYLYGVLLSLGGTGIAVTGTAAAFALAHVTVWGFWVLPLDLAAGLVLSWQRAATGRWSVPAATHVLANSLAIL